MAYPNKSSRPSAWFLALTLLLPTLAHARNESGDAEAPRARHATALRTPTALRAPEIAATFEPFATPPQTLVGRSSRPGKTQLHPGFPVFLGAPTNGQPYSPTLDDIDGDGADEIFLTGQHTFGLRGDGTFLPGWPTEEMEFSGYGTNGALPGPSVADFVPGGPKEVLWTTRDWFAGSSRLWTFNARQFDGDDLPGYPQQTPNDFSNALETPFVVGDTDCDGLLEAWGAHTLGNNSIDYRVSALDASGQRLFTTDLDPGQDVHGLYFGDLDGDKNPEMFAIAWRDPSYYLHVFAADGSERPGYPIVLLTLSAGLLTLGPPIPVDLDGDSDLELLLGHGHDGAGVSWARCRHHDAAPCAGFPIQIAANSQVLYLGVGDVTGDRKPELLATEKQLDGDYRFFVIDLGTGEPLPGWPVDLPGWPKGFPTVVDVSNDGIQDIVFATFPGLLHAFSGNGQLLDGYPQEMAGPSISGVAAGDIDGDGLFELVAATWDGWVYAWDTPGEVLPFRADWPMRGINAHNTGVFGDLHPLSTDSDHDGVADRCDRCPGFDDRLDSDGDGIPDDCVFLNGGRFRVEVEWRDFDGNQGHGVMVPYDTDDSALFWFFSPDNWEMLVKVLDGCGINNRFWVFSAATTNVEYTLRVTDTVTGTIKEYSNPLGIAADAVTDTNAFALCPSDTPTSPRSDL